MPGGVRWRVLAFAFALAVVTYLDRIAISAAAPYMMRDLGLTVLEMSVVFGAFTLAYSLFEIPSGWLGDVRGPRRVLTRIVLWWSGFTMLTGAARGYASLLTVRFLFGAGEAGAFPNIARSFSRWFPASERGRANGVMFLGSRLGGMLSAPIALVLIAHTGWRATFVALGAIGLVWAAAWYRWYRDDPAAHSAVTPAELAWIVEGRAPDSVAATPWRALLTSPNVYALCGMYFAFGYGLYFYFTWLPTYLVRVLGFSLLESGFFASLPFLLAGLADVAGGWATDRLSRRLGLRVGRCYLGAASFSASAILLFASTLPGPAVLRAVLLASALGSADLALSACWAVPLDIAPSHAGVVSGCMNTFGNLGGLVGPLVVGIAVDRWHSWTIPLHLAAVVYLAGAVGWLVIDPTRRLGDTRSQIPITPDP